MSRSGDWDPLGHLVCVASAESSSTYQYGPSGMREKITVVTPETTRTTQCVYDGATLVAEHDSDGTTYRYLWGPGRTPLAVEVSRPGQAAAVYTYHTDAFGSVVAIRDATGFPVAEYRYDAFGGVSVGGSWSNDPALASRNPIRYRSYYYDTATALYYLPARYYEPETARFLSPDPAPPSAGDPLSLNAYTYCQGDPVDAEDPSGARHEAGGGASEPGIKYYLARAASLVKQAYAGATRWTRKAYCDVKKAGAEVGDFAKGVAGSGVLALKNLFRGPAAGPAAAGGEVIAWAEVVRQSAAGRKLMDAHASGDLAAPYIASAIYDGNDDLAEEIRSAAWTYYVVDVPTIEALRAGYIDETYSYDQVADWTKATKTYKLGVVPVTDRLINGNW